MAKKRSQKPKKGQPKTKKIQKEVDAKSGTSENIADISTISIPIDVIFALNSSSMRHFDANYIKEEPVDPIFRTSFCPNKKLTMRYMSKLQNFQKCKPTDPTERSIFNSPPQNLIEVTPSSEEMNSFKSNEETMPYVLSVPTDKLFRPVGLGMIIKEESNKTENILSNELQTMNTNLSDGLFETQPQILENVSPATTIIKEELESNTLDSTDPSISNSIHRKFVELTSLPEKIDSLRRLVHDKPGIISALKCNDETMPYLQSLPTDTLLQKISRLVGDLQGMIVNEEPTETKNNFNNLQPVRNVGPLSTIIKEELDEPNEMDSGFEYNTHGISTTDLLSTNEDVLTRKCLQEPSRVNHIEILIDEEIVPCDKVVLTANPRSLTSINKKGLVSATQASLPYSDHTVIQCEPMNGVESMNTDDPMNKGERVSPILHLAKEIERISELEPINLREPIFPTLIPSLSCNARAPTSPRVGHTKPKIANSTNRHRNQAKQSIDLEQNSSVRISSSSSVSAGKSSCFNKENFLTNKVGREERRSIEYETSSKHFTEHQENNLGNLSNSTFGSHMLSPKHCIENQRYSKHFSRKRSRSRSHQRYYRYREPDDGNRYDPHHLSSPKLGNTSRAFENYTSTTDNQRRYFTEPKRTSSTKASSSNSISIDKMRYFKNENRRSEIETSSMCHRERRENFLDNLTNFTSRNRILSPELCIENQRYQNHFSRKRSRSRSYERDYGYQCECDDDRGYEPWPCSRRKFHHVTNPELLNSTSLYRNISSHTTDNRREYVNDIEQTSSDRASDRIRFYKNENRRSSGIATSSITIIENDKKYLTRKRPRSRSSERYSRYQLKSYIHEPSLSPVVTRSHHIDSHKYSKSCEKRSRRLHEYDYENVRREKIHRDPSESETYYHGTSFNNEYCPPYLSMSTNQRKNVNNWSSIRFSVSPDTSKFRERKEESDSDYSWEDPSPPKSNKNVPIKSLLENLDPTVKQKLQMFNSGLKTEFDLDEIERKKKELFRVINENIAEESRKRLAELDLLIQKKKDDYVRKLYGTNYFYNCDNDPALSNVEIAKKLKPFKSIVPPDAPLLDKMNMINITNGRRQAPAQGQLRSKLLR